VVLEALNIPGADGNMQGRTMPLRLFIDAVYALRPIELARFAPLVVAHRGDPVADRLLHEAERYLTTDFATAFDPDLPGPIVLGGGVIAHLEGLGVAIADIVRNAGLVPEIHSATDGSVGAIVLAMRSAGLKVDVATFETITASVAERTATTAISA